MLFRLPLAKHFPVRRELKPFSSLYLTPKNQPLAKHFPVRRELKRDIQSLVVRAVGYLLAKQFPVRREWKHNCDDVINCVYVLAKHFPVRREWKPVE